VRDFDAVIALDPRDADAYNNRSWTRAATDDLQAALSDCDRALRLDPGLTIELDSRGLANLKLGRTAEAIRDYSDASHSLRRVRLVYLSSATPNGHTALSVLHRLNESLNSFPSGTPKRT
jgi:tetratricopeptide (TPR) repeat protein